MNLVHIAKNINYPSLFKKYKLIGIGCAMACSSYRYNAWEKALPDYWSISVQGKSLLYFLRDSLCWPITVPLVMRGQID